MPMHKIVIKIGDKEYDTGSLISTDNPIGEDWVMVGDMLAEYIYGQGDGEVNDDAPIYC